MNMKRFLGMMPSTEIEIEKCYKDKDGYKIIINKVLDSQMNYITISYGGLLSRNAFCVEADFNFYY